MTRTIGTNSTEGLRCEVYPPALPSMNSGTTKTLPPRQQFLVYEETRLPGCGDSIPRSSFDSINV